MKKKILCAIISIILICSTSFTCYASTQMMIGVDTAGIFNSNTLEGAPDSILKFGEFLSVMHHAGNVMSIHGYNEVITGYCDKNDLIYKETVYYAELPFKAALNQYSLLVDVAKYMYLFSVEGLEFVKDDGRPTLIQQQTFFKIRNAAISLEAMGYRLVVERAYTYVDENLEQSYATGARLDLTLYAGNVVIDIPLPEYDEETETVKYSEIEQIFVDCGLVRINNSMTFEDSSVESFLPYNVDFSSLSFVIME